MIIAGSGGKEGGMDSISATTGMIEGSDRQVKPVPDTKIWER